MTFDGNAGSWGLGIVAALGLLLIGSVASAQSTGDGATSGSGASPAGGGTDNEALAKKLSNPIASLISVPIQFNFDTGYGPADGNKAFVNIQPVIPFELSDDLTLITRTILPVAWQNDIAGRSGTQFGLGDTLQSFFFAPKPTDTSLGTLTWGVGPAITLPTSTDRLLGSGTLAAGPTGIFLFQQGPWTYGMLGGQQWGMVDTRGSTPEVNYTFFQPFLAYTTKSAWTFSLNTEGRYDWSAAGGGDAALPVNATVSKLTDISGQKVQFQVGARYWANSPKGGPEGFGARFGVTFLFPN